MTRCFFKYVSHTQTQTERMTLSWAGTAKRLLGEIIITISIIITVVVVFVSFLLLFLTWKKLYMRGSIDSINK